jgi:hypothetical protein
MSHTGTPHIAYVISRSIYRPDKGPFILYPNTRTIVICARPLQASYASLTLTQHITTVRKITGRCLQHFRAKIYIDPYSYRFVVQIGLVIIVIIVIIFDSYGSHILRKRTIRPCIRVSPIGTNVPSCDGYILRMILDD